MRLKYKELFEKAIYALIESNGGSLEQALDDMKITDEKTREAIADELDWYDEVDDEEDADEDDDDLDLDEWLDERGLDTREKVQEYIRNLMDVYEQEPGDLTHEETEVLRRSGAIDD